MVGIATTHLEDVDIFNLLGLDPYGLRTHSSESVLREIRRARHRVMLVAHPDKAKDGSEIAQRLNILKDFFYNFDSGHANIPSRVTELVRRGRQGWVSTWNPWLCREDPGFRKPIPVYSQRFESKTPTSPHGQRTESCPGSSPFNTIVLSRWTRSSSPSPESLFRRRGTASRPGSSPSNPIVLDCKSICDVPSPEPLPRESGKPRRKRRTRRHPDKRAYHLSRSF